MTQAYENVMEMNSFEEIEQIEVGVPIESEIDDLLGNLNPRYFEESMTLDDARQKAYTSDVSMSSNFNVFTTF
ncbi:MAG: hypothetical protein ACW986_06230 [Promethearchaeota archaeon]